MVVFNPQLLQAHQWRNLIQIRRNLQRWVSWNILQENKRVPRRPLESQMVAYLVSSNQNISIFICYSVTCIKIKRKVLLSISSINYIARQLKILITTYLSYGKLLSNSYLSDIYYSYLVITKEEATHSIEKFILETSIKHSNIGLKVRLSPSLLILNLNYLNHRPFSISSRTQKMPGLHIRKKQWIFIIYLREH